MIHFIGIVGPVRSGKTSAIQHWIQQRSSVGGFICPDNDEGKKVLIDIASNTVYPLEIDPNDTETAIQRVGRFALSASTIKFANVLIGQQKGHYTYYILDEIGKLECEGKGIAPALEQILQWESSDDIVVLIVVRSSLQDMIRQKWSFPHLYWLHQSYFTKSLNGLILAGGASTRMGKDKSTIVYHDMPQKTWLMEKLSLCCSKIYISVKSKNAHNEIEDQIGIQDLGPLNGLISYSENFEEPVLVVGIDYPNVDLGVFFELIDQRNTEALATVAFEEESGFYTPWLGIYETKCLHLIKKFVANGGKSLQEFLRHHPIQKFNSKKRDILLNINDIEAFKNWNNR